jgi:mitochondrial distribution and morphology protein 31
MTQNDLLFGCICHRQQPATSKFVLLVLVSFCVQSISSDYVAQSISNYLTSETGIMIVFESAIVPKWKDSRISFKNVYIARRSPTAVSHSPDDNYHIEEGKTILEPSDPYANVTTFDLMVDSIDVTLSLWQWLDGKGLVKDAVVKGVRGVVGKYSLTLCS